MRMFRRQRQQYLFAGALGVVAVVNVLFFAILHAPIRSQYFRLQDSIQKNKVEVQARRQRIDYLEKLSGKLETSAQDKAELFRSHFLPRNVGWSETVPLLENALQKSGVKNQNVSFSIADVPQYGLYSVTIRLPVVGSYPNVVNFIRELEESRTFFIINSIGVHGNTNPALREVEMTLNLETFFYQ